MKINKAQKLQLESWKKIKDIEHVSISGFLIAQPRIWWVCIILVQVIWLISEITETVDIYLRALNIGSILFAAMLYIRFRLYWPITRQCLNWDKVDELLQNKNT